jgi:hypothetical protein
MAKRIVYQIDPKLINPDGSFPDFVFKSKFQKYHQKKWIYVLYSNRIAHALERNIPFKLSFRSFLNFCRSTNYHILRGPSRDEMSIDRIDNLRGYTEDNIQMLSNGDNSRKYQQHDSKRGSEVNNKPIYIFIVIGSTK